MLQHMSADDAGTIFLTPEKLTSARDKSQVKTRLDKHPHPGKGDLSAISTNTHIQTRAISQQFNSA